MKVDFSLSPKLRKFLEIGNEFGRMDLGEKFPVSIRRKYSHGQTIVIFPSEDYPFFLGSEAKRIIETATAFSLDVTLWSSNNVAVIEVTDYFPISK